MTPWKALRAKVYLHTPGECRLDKHILSLRGTLRVLRKIFRLTPAEVARVNGYDSLEGASRQGIFTYARRMSPRQTHSQPAGHPAGAKEDISADACGSRSSERV